jgi:ubiquinone/menaquinone biosynthesis C-methylase UbiE
LVKNFVRCDGQFLPFRDGVFDVVRCFHVIEHVLNPFLLLRELVRVSCYKVWLRCPHRFGDKFRIQVLRKKCDSHLHFLNKRWFVEFGSRLGCYVYCKTIGFLGLPFVNFLPNELEVNLIKC